jgi:hypothetical protein
MSPSKESARLSALIAELGGEIERLIQTGALTDVGAEDLTKLVSGAVKLYATAVEETGTDAAVIDGTVSTTEAMVVACAMLRAQHMNPFDLALWFSKAAPNAR